MKNFMRSFLFTLQGLALLLSVATFTSCGGDDENGGGKTAVQFDPLISIRTDGGIAVLQLSAPAGTTWTAEVVSGSWAWFDARYTKKSLQGTVGTSLKDREIAIYYEANTTTSKREAMIRFTYAGEMPVELPMVQYGEAQNTYPAENNASWPEVPAMKQNANFTYLTHYCTVRNQQDNKTFTGRNYTMCFDRSKRASWWVAYPLHSTYLGSGRPNPDPWQYDPRLATDIQANLGIGSYYGKYDRGHQIPNADRNADMTPGGMCYQTFYCSNATPQASELNQNEWASLEGKVRGWVCSDTLYVVTGAWWSNNPKTTTDRSGNVCPLPDYYFKVVARTVKGNIRSRGDLLGNYAASNLKTIGFWVANATGQGEPKQWVKSVAEIEALTGFTFFPTLPAEVKQQKSPSSWGL